LELLKVKGDLERELEQGVLELSTVFTGGSTGWPGFGVLVTLGLRGALDHQPAVQ
jgi:hypothetical protein